MKREEQINHHPFSPGRYCMPDSDLSLGLFPIPPSSNRNAIFLHFWLQIARRDLSPVPFYHLTVVLSVPFRPKWTLHLLRRQFTCLHLVRAICKAKAKRQDSERGGNFRAQISFHLWYQSASLSRVEWERELWIWNTAIQRPVHGCVIHSDTASPTRT